MKTKTITIGDRTFSIAALNMEQVEAILEADIPAFDNRGWRARSWKTITESMSNADPSTAPDLAELRRTLDLPSFNQLHSAVLEISGLKAVKPGETPAALESTSSTSAAA